MPKDCSKSYFCHEKVGGGGWVDLVLSEISLGHNNS